MTKGLAHRLFPLAILAGAIALYPALRGLPFESWFFPATLLALVCLVAAAILVRDLRWRPADSDQPLIDQPGRFLLGVALAAGYLALVPLLGFFTASALLILATPLSLGYARMRVILPTLVVFLGAVWVIFVFVFQRPLPRGWLI